MRAIDTPAVTKHRRQPADADVPVVPGTVLPAVQRDLGERLIVVKGVDYEPDRRPMATEQREVDAIEVGRRSKRQRTAARGAKVEDGLTCIKHANRFLAV